MIEKLSVDELNAYVNENISSFHQRRLAKLEQISLKDILRKKNPYLFRAKNLLVASDLVESLMQAFLSSSEEPMFGYFLEDLAIFIANRVFGGIKSASQGVDLEFSKNNIRYLVSIKSGPNWGNSSQHKKLEQDLNNCVRRLKQSGANINIQPVLGICYGKVRTVFTPNYLKVVGQSFWFLISDNENLYTDIIEPIGYKAQEKNQAYLESRSALLNKLTIEFSGSFCKPNGSIDWEKLVRFNSKNLTEKDKEVL